MGEIPWYLLVPLALVATALAVLLLDASVTVYRHFRPPQGPPPSQPQQDAAIGLAALAQPRDDMRPFDWETIDGLDERLGLLATRAAQVSGEATLETNTAFVDATTALLRFSTSRQSRIDTTTWDLLQALWETCATLGRLAVLPERRDDPETIRFWVYATAKKRQAVVDRLAAIKARHGGQ